MQQGEAARPVPSCPAEATVEMLEALCRLMDLVEAHPRLAPKLVMVCVRVPALQPLLGAHIPAFA